MRRRGPWVVFLAALAVRLVYLLQIRGTPITDVLLIDSATYDRFARMILAGTFRGEDVYTMNPLYPYVLAGIYAVTGGSVFAVLVIQAVLGALSAALVFVLGRRWFDARTAWVAGFGAALYAPGVFYCGALLTPVLIDTFGIAALVLLAGWRERPRVSLLVGAGILTGLATLGRGSAILWVPLAGIFFRAAAGAWSRAARPWAVFAASALALVAAASVRNYAIEGRIVPVSANYAAFYLGHSAEANGLYVMPRFTETAAFEGEVTGVRAALSKEMGRALTQAEASNELVRRGVNWALAHPSDELKLAARKLYYFWNRAESPTNLSFAFAREFSSLLCLLPIGFGLVAPLGLAGMVLARRRWREHLLLRLAVAAPLAACILFFVSAEYRMPAVAPLMLFAAYAVTRGAAAIARWMRPADRPAASAPARRRERVARAPRAAPADPAGAWLALALLPVFGFACNVQTPLLRAQALNRVPYYDAGVLYKDRGQLDRAEAMLRRSLAIDPRYVPALEAMSDLENRRGNTAAALRYRDAARTGGGAGASPGAGGAGVRPEDRDRMAAEELYQTGQYAAARDAFARLRQRYEAIGAHESAVGVANNLALALHRLRRDAEAETLLRDLVRSDPGYVRAHTNLALVLEAEGRSAEAQAEYRRALEIEPGNVRARRALERMGTR